MDQRPREVVLQACGHTASDQKASDRTQVVEKLKYLALTAQFRKRMSVHRRGMSITFRSPCSPRGTVFSTFLNSIMTGLGFF